MKFLDKNTRVTLHIECCDIAFDVAKDIKFTKKQHQELVCVTIKEHARRTQTAGTGSKTEVSINLHLNKDEEEYRDTLLHELAHSMCYIKYKGNVGHGPEWKHIMVLMGQEPKRCHNISLADAYPDKYRHYTCECTRTYEFSKRKLNKMRRGNVYRCICEREIKPLTGEEKEMAARAARATITTGETPQPTYSMVCKTCGETLTITKRRHNKIKKGTVYIHKTCGGQFRAAGRSL